MSNSSLEKIFQILAVIFILVAAFFLWRDNYDGVFVSAALGCVSFFLSFRFQIKERIDEWEAEHLDKEFDEEENHRKSLFEADFEQTEIDEFELDGNKEKIPIER